MAWHGGWEPLWLAKKTHPCNHTNCIHHRGSPADGEMDQLAEALHRQVILGYQMKGGSPSPCKASPLLLFLLHTWYAIPCLVYVCLMMSLLGALCVAYIPAGSHQLVFIVWTWEEVRAGGALPHLSWVSQLESFQIVFVAKWKSIVFKWGFWITRTLSGAFIFTRVMDVHHLL